jgi:hypothetical protein
MSEQHTKTEKDAFRTFHLSPVASLRLKIILNLRIILIHLDYPGYFLWHSGIAVVGSICWGVIFAKEE